MVGTDFKSGCEAAIPSLVCSIRTRPRQWKSERAPAVSLFFILSNREESVMKNIILGTAGHVDHGKTTLVKRLTGVDTDRLKEEKDRGITIELGFAPLELPSGQHVGIVDVPGHEKFIKNMLSGSTGIDFALFVIAADEGVMPQTREHMDILRLLHVHRGVVALTKIDMADEEWLELVREDVRAFIDKSPLAGAKICEVSAVTGEGIPELLQELDRVCTEVTERSALGSCRLAIDRVFTLSGFGTVVTGTMWKGKIKLGQTVELFPSEKQARVRTIQVHGEKRTAAFAGERVAVNLTGVDKSEISRGSWLTLPGALTNSFRLDVELELLESAPPLEHRCRVHIHHGTSEALARVNLLDRETLNPGEKAPAQLELEEPLCPQPGDRFVIRFYSPVFTIGGGTVLDPAAKKHKRFDEAELERLAALTADDPGKVLLAAMQKEHRFWTAAQMARFLETDDASVQELSERLCSEGGLLAFPDGAFLAEASFRKKSDELIRMVEEYCAAYPLRPGLPAEDAWAKIYPGISQNLIRGLTERPEGDDRLENRNGLLCPKGYRVNMDSRLQKHVEELRGIYTDAELAPPAWSEATAWNDMQPKERAELLLWFIRGGEMIKIAEDIVFSRIALENAAALLREKTGDTFTLAEARDILGTSRKYAIYILDWLSAGGQILRDGDDRKWK